MLASLSNAMTVCHSVFSCFCPLARSFHVSVVAMRRRAMGTPPVVARISGSAPRWPMRITLFTDPAMSVLRSSWILQSVRFERNAEAGPVDLGHHRVDGRLPGGRGPARRDDRAVPRGLGPVGRLLHGASHPEHVPADRRRGRPAG